MLMIR